ncbi:MAG: multicopper oxidase domain-containing protein [Gemmatimonadaceae bacterium]
MRIRRALVLLAVLSPLIGSAPRREVPVMLPNANLHRAGTLEHGVLTVTLEAAESEIAFGAHERSLRIAAFSEAGKAPMLPGPFIRAPQGTEMHLSMHNSLAVPLTFLVPAAIHGAPDQPDAMDSMVVAPGAVGQFSIHATVPGNYVYRAIGHDDASVVAELTGALAGAMVIDTAGAAAEPRDRVLVIMAVPDSQWVVKVDSMGRAALRRARGTVLLGGLGGQFTYTINGRSWPGTERVAATAGDTLHWRVINASGQLHAMHLHGFYYRVDALTGGLAARFPRPVPGEMVVTQLLAPLSSMSMTWSPDRPGNWLFHCHFAIHLVSDPNLAVPGDRHGGDMSMQNMSGMALGVVVADRPAAQQPPVAAHARRLRLIAEAGPTVKSRGATDTMPSMHFVLEEHGRQIAGTAELSPELDLTRGEPVAITIVNHLAEPTSVHWHGIEVEDSYVDGVPGFSGSGTRLAPEIAPGDSFVARFTPPRSGTYMYHAHVDELREQLAGLEGALVVRDSSAAPPPSDHTFFLKGLAVDPAHPLGINGQTNPDTVVLRVGEPARLRVLNLATTALAPVFSLTARPDSALNLARDTMVVQWRPLAKDGFDLPVAARRSHAAREIVGQGETYDFEYVPLRKGNLNLEVRSRLAGTPLIVRVPIHVK